MIYSAKMTRYRIDMSSFSFATKNKFSCRVLYLRSLYFLTSQLSRGLHTPTYPQQVTHDSLPTTNQVTP